MTKTMTEQDLKKWGAEIKAWRKKNGYTIKNLAEFIDVSPRSISSIEKGGNANTKYYIEALKLARKSK